MNKTKRVMYLTGEDFYLMTYLILLSLNFFLGGAGVNKKPKKFKDHRKLSIIVQLLSDERLVDLINRYDGKVVTNFEDREFLFKSFSDAEVHKKEINKILQVLEKRGYISLECGGQAGVYDVTLNTDRVPKGFLDYDNFNCEYDSLAILKSNVARLNTLTLNTFVDKIYRDNGVNVWAL